MTEHQKCVSKDWLVDGGKMGEVIRAIDWSKTPLGSIASWPQSLRTTVSLCLASNFPISIAWGSQRTQIYNDGYWPICGEKHPHSMGQDFKECWLSAWPAIGEAFERASAGETSFIENQRMFLDRNGYLEETFFTFSFSPIRDETGGVGGLFHPVTEMTQQTLAERRLEVLRDLADRTAETKTVREGCSLVTQILAEYQLDLPFTLLYLLDASGKQAQLVECTGIKKGTIASPEVVNLEASGQPAWGLALAEVVKLGQTKQIDDLQSWLAPLSIGPYPESPQTALVMPINLPGVDCLFGLLVAGVSSRRPLDRAYHTFYMMLEESVTKAIANARAYEEERKRAEALAELDRAKTAFFNNISHEFRTPLTLMLDPLEDTLANPDGPMPSDREQLEIAYRNSQRLLKLVNTLLDFSRIEAGRIEAVYEPTDLAMLTAELAGVFRSAIERAGVRLRVDCPPLPEPAYVDREMWEKIVLNLVSNAFKFTLDGEISVVLRSSDRQIELEVQDTGTGIPEEELSQIFERFYRVKRAGGRSFEGSGIGLSLVQELVKLHQGTIKVSSVFGQGTCFTVSIPRGCASKPSERRGAPRSLASTAMKAALYVEEALRWLPLEEESTSTTEDKHTVVEEFPLSSESTRILIADDNADMRQYLKRLLSQQYEVETVKDGVAAFIAIRQQMPDLLLTDVMMPRLNGFELLQSLRTHPQTRELPIILLSARAGEESRIEGLEAGADDYLIKRFSARELLARVQATLKLAQLRQEATRREQNLKAAEETQKQVSTILESITDAFLACDRQWRFTYANEQALRLLHKTREELLGKQVWSEVFPEAVGTQIYHKLHHAITESVGFVSEYHSPLLDIWLEIHAYPSPEGLAVYFHDINDRKQSQAERDRHFEQEQAARAAAERANRMKDEFLTVLSHELRTPLNPILGWTKILQTGSLDKTKVAQGLATIERNVKLQTQLIDDLLDIAKILHGKLSLQITEVNLSEVIEAALDTVRTAAKAKSISLHPLLATVEQVSGDAARLQQVVWNLLSNAIEFTPNGGRVDILLQRIGTQTEIMVSDTGRGINPEFLPHIFDSFRQEDASTTRSYGGLGLGLSIVRQLVEAHGGSITVDSPGIGFGAIFTVLLPIVNVESEIKPTNESPQQELDLTGIRVLAVDDQADARELLTVLLTHYGAEVLTVSRAVEVLDNLESFQPDVLVSDIGMPEVNGFDLLQQIRALPPEKKGQIPAIALTAYAREEDLQRALSSGFQLHVTKPLDVKQLVEAVLIVAQN